MAEYINERFFEISLVFSRWPLISSKCQIVSGPFTAFSIFKRQHLLQYLSFACHPLSSHCASQQIRELNIILIFNFHLICGSEWAIIRGQVSLSIEAREFKTLATVQQKEPGFRIIFFN